MRAVMCENENNKKKREKNFSIEMVELDDVENKKKDWHKELFVLNFRLISTRLFQYPLTLLALASIGTKTNRSIQFE